MKKINLLLACFAMFALVFTSCTKDDATGDNSGEKATLSFGAIVNDLANKSTNKQSDVDDLPVCSDDTPFYVEIVLLQGEEAIVGETGAPQRIDLVAGQVFTEEDPLLELDPGTYTLDHFAVYNEGGTLIWLAPKGGVLAEFVDNPLPLNISLGAGVKKYVDVSVLCFDDRDVNEYGYLFFEFDKTEAFKFCFFANYCPPEDNGKHKTANYSVNIWLGTDNTGTPLYTNESPVTSVNADGDYTAATTCFPLPVNDDLDEPYLYYEVTLLDWPGNYGTVAPNTVKSGVLTAQDVMDNFVGEDDVDYEHLRFGCDDDTTPPMDSDNDGVIDDNDDCPDTPAGTEVDSDGCPVNGGDQDSDEDGVLDSIDECDNTPVGATVNEVGCPDSDGDGVFDNIDNCDDTPSGVEVDANGCPVGGNGCVDLPAPCELDVPSELEEYCFETYVQEADSNGWITINSAAEFDLYYDEGVVAEVLSEVSITLNGSAVNVTLDSPIADQDRITAYAIEIRPSEDGTMSTTCWESQCANVTGEDQFGPIVNVFEEFEYSYPFYVRVSTISCFTPDVTPGG
ncbi:hypothetical protein [Salinimicrobium flavum]|uniref:Thrombospondin type 3 repeat-containing protein n=1 Tax=Salinimicrobium flavum TaxID=1737065 RepID=A0ABW5J055_9FLAO